MGPPAPAPAPVALLPDPPLAVQVAWRCEPALAGRPLASAPEGWVRRPLGL